MDNAAVDTARRRRTKAESVGGIDVECPDAAEIGRALVARNAGRHSRSRLQNSSHRRWSYVDSEIYSS